MSRTRLVNATWKFIRLVLLGTMAAALAIGTSPAAAGSPAQASPDGIWQKIDEASFRPTGMRLIVPQQYEVFALNESALERVLEAAPLESAPEAQTNQTFLNVPMPDGSLMRLRILEAPIMAPELAAKFPEITTYIGKGVDDPTATARLDKTPAGFHGMIRTTRGTVFIDPYSQGDTSHYLSYYTSEMGPNTKGYDEINPLGDPSEIEKLVKENAPFSTGPQLRTYRLAMAATGEYTQFHGGTVPLAMAAIVTSVNRVTGVYEVEVAVRMELIPNNNLIVYTDPATDPYTNNNGSTMLGQNQSNLDSVIGSANYDIGHVFSTGGGGVAYLGVVCEAGYKARGVTGSSAPIGDPYDIDYVAHEIGHQFGANHTFNGSSGSCSGGNRNASTAYEPGSASTIMGYAGICSPQNLQPHSDDDFHGVSYDEIVAYTNAGYGNTCAAITNTGNSAPLVSLPAGGFTIPKGTPFSLTGTATDPDGDVLTFDWDEFDLGPAGHPDSPSGNAPIFRTFIPSPSPTRVFPKWSDIVNNTHTIGELLPTYARNLTFRFIARDNYDGASPGGVSYATIQFSVSGTAGPFLVTAPNTAVTWIPGETQTVTWDVSGTNSTPVNCSNVDINLSEDGGYTYPTTLLAATPNDGAQDITVPNVQTTQARVQVACATSIFFDISNTNFTIEGAPDNLLAVTKTVQPDAGLLPGDPLTYTISVGNSGAAVASTTITDEFPTGVTNPVCNSVPGDLNVTTDIASGGQAEFVCNAEVDAAIALPLSITADRTLVSPGEAVTLTINISNPHPALGLEGVTVTSPEGLACTPALGSPITLDPGADQDYLCPNVVVDETTTFHAAAAGEANIVNVASASAPGDPGSPRTGEAASTITLEDNTSVTITAEAVALSATKTVEPGDALLPGDPLTYTINVGNVGAISATVAVVDDFPAGTIDPVCDGMPGNLNTQVDLTAGETTDFTCTAQVEPTLALDLEVTADRTSITPGEAVTLTITASNPNVGVPVIGLTLTSPELASCAPDLATPVDLAPGESQMYVCPDVAPDATHTYNVEAQAEGQIVNTASISAEGGPVEPILAEAESRITLQAAQSVEVQVGFSIFLPAIQNNAAGQSALRALPVLALISVAIWLFRRSR